MSDGKAENSRISSSDGRLHVGDVIDGKYTVLHQIGRGGMSTVWLVLNEKVNKQWAVKEVRKDGRTNSEVIRQNLITETRILTRLHHPHLPSIIDVIDCRDTYLIIMDYIEGRTLKNLLDEEGAQPQDDVVNWALQLCSVLSYLHSQHIIYRDMKPGNVMLKPDGNVVLIDFGTAREYKDSQNEDTVCLGTKGYAAPEQYGGEGQSDARTDIYTLGATMYHLVTGKNPAKPPYEMRPIREWDPSYSSGLEKIILKCTRSNPDERYQTADELAYALRHYRELDNGTMRRKKKAWHRFLALIVLSAGCFAASLYTGQSARIYVSDTYSQQIHLAETSTTDSARESAYVEAIQTMPSRETAYEELLEQVYLADGNFSQDEAERMTAVLGYRGARDTETAEQRFREGNQSGYDSFIYNLGLAYFYYYEGNGNKSLAKPWFRLARESKTLPEAKKTRAARFYELAEDEEAGQRADLAGDHPVSYADVWKSLKSVSDGDLVQQDNVRTALVVYRELTAQISAHAQDFRRAGIAEKDLEAELSNVQTRLNHDILPSPSFDPDTDQAIADTVKANLTNAEEAVKTAFSVAGKNLDALSASETADSAVSTVSSEPDSGLTSAEELSRLQKEGGVKS